MTDHPTPARGPESECLTGVGRDADLIYNALLRLERKLEAQIPKGSTPVTTGIQWLLGTFYTVQAIREEIGNGLSKEGR
jgi:hypothetical protein